MKKYIIKIIIVIGIIIIFSVSAFAVDCEQGNLLNHEYEELICLLGIMCGIAFIMGINQ